MVRRKSVGGAIPAGPEVTSPIPPPPPTYPAPVAPEDDRNGLNNSASSKTGEKNFASCFAERCGGYLTSE